MTSTTHPLHPRAISQPTRAEPEEETRPWGTWQVLNVGQGYKIKQINVAPHRRLSLQQHLHRSEHWIVVAGTATCTVGSRQLGAGQGERVDVPRGWVHRIANDGDTEVILLEVQLGNYTGEDDITRLEDDYGRCPIRDTRRV